MQHNILFFVCLSKSESTSLKDLWSKVAPMHRKGVVFSKMFVLRSMGLSLHKHIILKNQGYPYSDNTKQ